MILHVESEEAQKVVVFLNGKPINHYICAEEGDNGWVEVVDVEAMAPLYAPEDLEAKRWEASTINERDAVAEINSLDQTAEEEKEDEWVPLKTKRISGRVEFRRLG